MNRKSGGKRDKNLIFVKFGNLDKSVKHCKNPKKPRTFSKEEKKKKFPKLTIVYENFLKLENFQKLKKS